jgi:hypothetical protein
MVGRAKMTVSVSNVEGLPLVIEGGERPLQVLRVELAGPEGQIARVSAAGLQGGRGPWVDVVLAEHVQGLVAVGLSAASAGREDVVVTVQSDDHSLSQTWGVLASDPGWTLHMVCHFHFDPVWWNSQANYTEDWPEPVKAAHPYLDFQAAAFDVVSAH